MSRQSEHAQSFRQLHRAGAPLVLFNAWDAGSAGAIAQGGAAAIATASWAMAAANGYADGENMPLQAVLAVSARIAASVDLPLSVDLEAGHAESADGVGANVAALIRSGAVGCNLEDGIPGAGRMRDIGEQVARLAAARASAQAAGLALFINARTDAFLLNKPERHADLMDEALERARAYAAAGADGLFVPGLADETLIAAVVAASSLPVNVMMGPGVPSIARLRELGVARISHGPAAYLAAMDLVRQTATAVHGQ